MTYENALKIIQPPAPGENAAYDLYLNNKEAVGNHYAASGRVPAGLTLNVPAHWVDRSALSLARIAAG